MKCQILFSGKKKKKKKKKKKITNLSSAEFTKRVAEVKKYLVITLVIIFSSSS